MTYTIHTGDALTVLKTMPSQSVNTVVTSPPYWALRDYGTGQWDGGDPACDHVKVEMRQKNLSSSSASTRGGAIKVATTNAITYCDTCDKCGAQRADEQVGLEASPEQYVQTMTTIFREVRRVLRDDGTLWLNLGDSYTGAKSGGRNDTDKMYPGDPDGLRATNTLNVQTHGLKQKDLVGIPWRVAFALQADGWYLRSEIIWAKPNPMPESVGDRPTKSHEQIFLLSKKPRYYYDAEAIREPAVSGGDRRSITKRLDAGVDSRNGNPSATRNKRTVWTVATHSFKEAHFATFPPKLIEPCVLAGCPERVCGTCGKACERIVDTPQWYKDLPGHHAPSGNLTKGVNAGFGSKPDSLSRPSFTVGWSDCGHNNWRPGVVLDPFSGAATTGVVALEHGREYVGIELNEQYVAMSEKRLSGCSNGDGASNRPGVRASTCHAPSGVPAAVDSINEENAAIAGVEKSCVCRGNGTHVCVSTGVEKCRNEREHRHQQTLGDAVAPVDNA